MSATLSELTVLLSHFSQYCEANDPLLEAQLTEEADIDTATEQASVIAEWIDGYKTLLRYRR